jgi:hypothetical protein
MIRQAGSVVEDGGKLKLTFPERMRSELQTAIDALKADREEALAQVAQLHSEELTRAGIVLKNAGVRIMVLEGGVTIGVWSDLDGWEVRSALRAFGADQLPVRYLDGTGIPLRYKLRLVPGEPVPTNVLTEMERQPEAPWRIRDRMLNAMGCRQDGIRWAEWKASALNRLFLEQGSAGKLGCITPKTIKHAEGSAKR